MMRTAILEGVGGYVPEQVLTNEDLERTMDTSDEWIRTRTGISQRRVSPPGVATVDLATEAGARALKSAGGGDVDAVIVATTTPDRMCPATAPEVASRLGAGAVTAFDVGAVCTGFVYALATASGLIAGQIADRVLVIGAESIRRFIDPQDRSTGVIFGDGGGAVVLRAGEPDELGAVGPFDLGSDGERSDLISVAAGGSRWPVDARAIDERANYLYMDGREVYRHAIPRMVASSQAVLAKKGWTVDDVDQLVAHQANVRILDIVGSKLGLAPEKCFVNIERYGNTAGASVPLALADADLVAGDKVLVTAFGGGLTWGSTVIVWPEL